MINAYLYALKKILSLPFGLYFIAVDLLEVDFAALDRLRFIVIVAAYQIQIFITLHQKTLRKSCVAIYQAVETSACK